MKQKLYITGVITTIAIILGIMFKINHYPGAGILTTAGIAFLLLVFLPAALFNHYKNEGGSLLLHFVTWLTCFVVFTSMLFKLMHWPGASFLLFIALPFPFVVFLPVYLIVTSGIKNFNINNTVYVLLLLTGVSLFTALLGLDVTKDKIEDSLNIAGSYNRMEKPLGRITVNNDSSPIAGSIDEVLGIINEYQGIIYNSIGLTEEEWNTDPERFANFASATGGKSPHKNGIRITDTRLEKGLRNLMSQFAEKPGCEILSKEAPDIFSFNPSAQDDGEWSKATLDNANVIWVLIYLNGLENNLEMIKASLY
ncbi:MAG TPA: hypothetical protein PKH02_05485 [Bacteroidales bacterium]|nr:hypothetical protein [Bacteroidales bacterium]